MVNIWKRLKAGFWSHWAVQTGCYTRYCQYLFSSLLFVRLNTLQIRWIRCKDWTDLLQKNVPTVWVKIQPYVGKIDWKHLLELCSILGSELWPKSIQCKVSNDAANVQKLHILVILLYTHKIGKIIPQKLHIIVIHLYTHKIGKIIPQKLHIIFILLILNWQDCATVLALDVIKHYNSETLKGANTLKIIVHYTFQYRLRCFLSLIDKTRRRLLLRARAKKLRKCAQN